MRGMRVPKTKIYTVDTRKSRADAELSVFLNLASGFQEHVSAKPTRKAPVFRYFFFKENPTVGVPKAQLESAFKAAAAAAAPAPVQPPPAAPAANVLPPAPMGSQGSYGEMHEDDDIDNLALVLAEQGVASQGEFDELAALMEQKAGISNNNMLGGGRRKSHQRKSRKSRHRKSRKSRKTRHRR